MDIREKLVELFDEAARICNNQDCRACGYFREANCINKTIIDHLIANGVTIQQWIPVSERLPKEGDDVLVFGYWHEKWQPLICHLSPHFKGSWYTMPAGMQVYSVTHWMPLPTPPKGE